MTYDETLDYMYRQLPMFHRIGPAAYKPSLDNIIALCSRIGNPQQKLRYVHIAGTNGKGSTSHLIASVLQEAGYKTGLYTSPHLKDFRERIRVNGEMIPREHVVTFVEKYKATWEDISPSFFEMTLALCFWYFAQENVDIVVLETGLGGRLDSTNIITPEVSVITNIGMDHMQLLGDSIEKIATEKAGIIKPHVPVVLGKMLAEAKEVMELKATLSKTNVYSVSNFELNPPAHPLLGEYQKENTRTALLALQVLTESGHWHVSAEALSKGYRKVIENTGLMGRWQILSKSPLTIADVAHNEDGLRMVCKQIENTPHHQLHFVLGMVSDKDISKVLALLPKTAMYYFCKANIPRGMDASELQKMASAFELRGQFYTSVVEAFQAAQSAALSDDLVFVGGSFFTVAEVV